MEGQKVYQFFIALLLLVFSSFVHAGTFTPTAGSSFTSNQLVVVSWSSDGSEQWVRAFGSNDARFYDSGRQASSTGQVSFVVPEGETQITITFYEKDRNSGSWSSQERDYSVTDGDDMVDPDPGGSGTTLADLSCSTDQIAKFNGSDWSCSEDETTSLDIDDIASAIEVLFCMEDEELITTNTGRLACTPAPSACPLFNSLEESFSFDGGLANQRFEVIGDATSSCFVENTEFFVSITMEGSESGSLTIGPENDPLPGSITTTNIIGRSGTAACAILFGCENFGRNNGG